MPVTAVIGAQWGDEAKGKIVDLLSQDAEIVARFNGGDNAGHTVINQFGTFKLRLTPNGFSNPETTSMIGSGVAVNLSTLIDEINTIQESGIQLVNRFWVSPRCNVVMPWHPLLEEIYEKAKGKSQTGTTRRGMGPVYADKVSYNGIRLADFENEEQLREKIEIQLGIKNPIFSAFQIKTFDTSTVHEEKMVEFKKIREIVREPFGLIQDALRKDSKIVLEGAQGALLDNNWGTYPFCTASNTLAGSASESLGMPPHQITNVIGVAKAYTTRVGAGPMPTELNDQIGEILLKDGSEFGTVTGRARRCGWLDLELVKFTTQLNGFTEIALTKLDVLDRLPVIKICTGYRRKEDHDRIWHYWEGDAGWLADCEPEYIDMNGWQTSIRGIRKFNQLPVNARLYIQKIEETLSVPIRYISVGPDREETIIL